MPKFNLTTQLTPKGDQIEAIKQLVCNLKNGVKQQVLLGATGTGKTFTIANVIKEVGKKTLVMVHNKTLAAQLYTEFKEFFKENKVEYFVSYFDFYQPEAYLPKSDTYIEKTAKSNEEIEMLRLSSLNSMATKDDVIVIASVAAIYSTVPPQDFKKHRIILSLKQTYKMKQLMYDLIKLQYFRNQVNSLPGTFATKGDVIEIVEGHDHNNKYRISFFGNEIEDISLVNTLNNKVIRKFDTIALYSASEYILDTDRRDESLRRINDEMEERIKYFKQGHKLIEAQRIEERTRHDIESLKELGYCSGIENYSRHLELRDEGETPYCIMDYLGDDWLLVVDESHNTLPQIRGMYEGDRSRKQNLSDHGFRLPSCLDNRPLNFNEFNNHISNVIYVSATPADYEIEKTNHTVIQQIVRPTGLLDPEITIKPTKNQIDELFVWLKKQKDKNERTLVTVLTIKMAQELTEYLKKLGHKVAYLHNEVKTIERVVIINDLRKGKYDVLIGINLLREGLDIPEVSLAIIFDGDKPGLFRSRTSLIQTFGRVARNKNGHVLVFADKITSALNEAVEETKRRRKIQEEYNIKYGITPQSIVKDINETITTSKEIKELEANSLFKEKMSLKNKTQAAIKIRKLMLDASKKQEYEKAAFYRDALAELEGIK